MPPASPFAPAEARDATSGSARATAADRAARVRFRRALALMAMTLVLPGSAQLVAGNRRIGRIAVWTWLGLVVLGLLTLLGMVLDHDLAFWLASQTTVLLLLRLALMVAAVAWVALFVDAWRIGQPLSLGMTHRRAVVGVNGVLCFSVMGTLLFGAHLVGVQRDFIVTMFGDGQVTGATDGRFNVLLLGGDAGAGRVGLRPDSMTVASVDAETGRTVLIGLPRNLTAFPFAKGSVMHEQFPDGFDCEGCLLNGVSTWAEDNPELFPGSEHPGVDATIMAIEGITGLEVNYWAMVNLEGFKGLVDAVGGVTLRVRQPIPVGLPHEDYFHYIEPGVRKLNGHDTLWYARAREGSDDYSRMARQKCVMNAMLQQVSPQVAVRNFEEIATASSDMMSTNLPASELDRFMALALKAKSRPVSTLSLVPPMIDTADPDIKVIRSKVRAAIAKAEGTTAKAPPARSSADASTQPTGESSGAAAEQPAEAQESAGEAATPADAEPEVTGGSVGSLRQGYAANQAEDLASAC